MKPLRLDTGHLNLFENIQPPMQHALTLPVTTQDTLPRDTGITVYVCASPFSHPHPKRGDVEHVAKRLRLLDDETYSALCRAADMLMEVPGGHGDVIDLLRRLAGGKP